jgi:hypothetical protein
MMLACLSGYVPASAADNDAVQDTAIVWAVDVSASMAQADPERYWVDAVSLGIDLAPFGTQAACLASNDDFVLWASLLSDIDSTLARKDMKSFMQDTECWDYTNFNVALTGALDLLAATEIKERHLFFVADISEGGFDLAGVADYSQEVSEAVAIGRKLADEGIITHFLFLGEFPENRVPLSLWDDIAAETGGEVTRVDNPALLPQTVETLYFEHFNYNKSVVSGINTTDVPHDIAIDLPSFPLDKARVYISSVAPLTGIQARADDSYPVLTQTRSYAVIDISRPLPKSLDLTLPPSGSADVRIYFLADVEAALSAAVDSAPELYAPDDGSENYRQKTTVTLTAKSSRAPLFEGGVPSGLDWAITAVLPSGETTDIDTGVVKCFKGSFSFDFYPESFGEYAYTLLVSSGGIGISAVAKVDVPSIELPVIEEEPYDYTLWIAGGIGALLILAACLFFAHNRRRRLDELSYADELQGDAGELPKAFTGKLDIYAIVLDGGDAEIPALSYRLGEMSGKKWARLSTIFERSGVPYRYPAAADIRLHPQASGAILVKNHSDAVFYRNGQAYHNGQQATLVFGQKIYVVFEEGVNEFEIYYHVSAETAVAGRRLRLGLSG